MGEPTLSLDEIPEPELGELFAIAEAAYWAAVRISGGERLHPLTVQRFRPFPESEGGPPDGWPTEYVAASDFDEIAEYVVKIEGKYAHLFRVMEVGGFDLNRLTLGLLNLVSQFDSSRKDAQDEADSHSDMQEVRRWESEADAYESCAASVRSLLSQNQSASSPPSNEPSGGLSVKGEGK
jgi:hypothetical protein